MDGAKVGVLSGHDDALRGEGDELPESGRGEVVGGVDGDVVAEVAVVFVVSVRLGQRSRSCAARGVEGDVGVTLMSWPVADLGDVFKPALEVREVIIEGGSPGLVVEPDDVVEGGVGVARVVSSEAAALGQRVVEVVDEASIEADRGAPLRGRGGGAAQHVEAVQGEAQGSERAKVVEDGAEQDVGGGGASRREEDVALSALDECAGGVLAGVRGEAPEAAQVGHLDGDEPRVAEDVGADLCDGDAPVAACQRFGDGPRGHDRRADAVPGHLCDAEQQSDFFCVWRQVVVVENEGRVGHLMISLSGVLRDDEGRIVMDFPGLAVSWLWGLACILYHLVVWWILCCGLFVVDGASCVVWWSGCWDKFFDALFVGVFLVF